MGSCVSVRKNPESVMKMRMSFCGTKSSNFVVPSSPVKELKPLNVDRPMGAGDVAGFKTFPDFGSKEETFFDSQAWLESDCEDDFYSVNGDFTPSRGNTPKHYNFSPVTPRIDKPISGYKPDDQKSEPSPTTEKKKRLADLFQESERNDPAHDLQNAAKTGTNTPFFSGASSVCTSERTPNGGLKPDSKNKLKPSVQCCIPRFLSTRGFNIEKKMTSPAHSRG